MDIGPDGLNFYVIEQIDEKRLSVLGRKILDDFFNAMPIGTIVKIEYVGKVKPKGGGRSYHNYKLEYDEETKPDKDIESSL